MNIAKFLRTLTLKNICQWLLLSMVFLPSPNIRKTRCSEKGESPIFSKKKLTPESRWLQNFYKIVSLKNF